MATNCSDVEGMMLAVGSVTLYAGIMTVLMFFDTLLTRRLHDMKTECYLESQRQKERVDRLLLMSNRE